jgi:hypothetical protein
MADRIPSTEQSFYKITEELDGLQDAITGLVDISRRPEPIELLQEGLLIPSNGPFQSLIFEDVEQSDDGWIGVTQYETVAMIAGVEPQNYDTNADTPPREFDATVSNFEQFKEAVAGAADGATIYVEPGTYVVDEKIVINSPVSIYGSGPTTIFQVGSGVSSPVPFQDIFWIRSSDVRLQGFKVNVTSPSVGGTHVVFFIAEDGEYINAANGVAGASGFKSVTKIENIEIVNVEVETELRVQAFLNINVDNIRVQGCSFKIFSPNSINTGSNILSTFYGCGGDILFQDNYFELKPSVPSNPVKWRRVFGFEALHFSLVAYGGLNLPVVQCSGRFTCRNNDFADKMNSLIYFGVEANDTYSIAPASGVELCVEKCNIIVEDLPSDPVGRTTSGRLLFSGCAVAVTGIYGNPGSSLAPVRVKNVLDILKSISFKESSITGGERGIIYARPGVNLGFPGSYNPPETEPYRLRSLTAGPLPVHIGDDVVINNVNDLKIREEGNLSNLASLVDVFGDRTLVTNTVVSSADLDAAFDNIPEDGVQPPADISRTGEGLFEIRTEYRLVQDGLALEFVPGTTIDILTEAQKEIINPRIPAVLVGVLEIRFLVRAINRLGDSLLNLFGTIR